jgi:general secretion pathway protein A
MLLNCYKLAEQPFGVTPDSRFLYLGPKHREALASLVYGTESNRGFLALIAKPGMGKTSLLYHYRAYLRDKARTAFVFRTDCDSREFIRHLLLDLGIDVAGMDLPAMHDRLNRLLTEEMQAGRRFVLVIDEAQNLDEKVLESVRLLSNFETPWMKLMQIVLAGQPQLADRLASPSMAQLRQRVSMIIKIDPLDADEVNLYIDHRLSAAGCENPKPLFTAGARKLIAEHSEGIPRNINNLCFNAMSLGCATKRKAIDRDIIVEVIADLDLEPLREKPVAAKTPVVEPKRQSAAASSVAKKHSSFGVFAPKLALASAVLLGFAWLVTHVGRHQERNLEMPVSAASVDPVPVSTPAIEANTPATSNGSETPATEPAASVPVVPAASSVASASQESVKVTQGQTLYQISRKKMGKYNPAVLEEIRGLNPWMSDPNHIQPGQKILIPSATTTSTDSQRATAQSVITAPAEAGKHNE